MVCAMDCSYTCHRFETPWKREITETHAARIYRMENRILLDKLEFYGIARKFYLLIKSYLCERHQSVLIYNTTMRSHIATVGFRKVRWLVAFSAL